MPTVKSATVIEKSSLKSTVTANLRSHANDPFVVKKVTQAKEVMSKVKLPDYLKK